ncbi:aminoglycoside phosphotransferase family protein [Pseudanabaena sp. PCC 6802]|uniref:aminoglycoside phosphotransferase family protein n=1 Tax=Pseudanabaena sp. PCC 6802 TaxID=118173 RepID=UPI000349B3CE|nr:aminoglycoside phosphotransferase family protein [Pseudanabaena sp. PCC 6802]
MTFMLSSQNAFNYLLEQGLCSQETEDRSQVELKAAKNFNLLLSWSDGRKILIKQERHNQEGKTAGEFSNEWRVHDFVNQFSEVSHLHPLLSEVLHFDANASIIVFNYLSEYLDLADFYTKENFFPTAIATEIGASLAKIHRTTLDCQEYQEFFCKESEDRKTALNPILNLGLERIEPEIFGLIPSDGIKFITLYQRYDSLGQALSDLAANCHPCCLTHNDLKLNNILLHNNWEGILNKAEPEQSNHSCIRLIDWERSNWGDPAFDLGTLIASYLQIWIGSLVISKSISIDESLRLAMIPLDLLQPSIAALARGYLNSFPEISEQRPDFLIRVIQFAGFGLIQQIQAMLQYQKSFGNTGICMLQVAKSLLSRPQQSIETVFGVTESELTQIDYYLV